MRLWDWLYPLPRFARLGRAPQWRPIVRRLVVMYCIHWLAQCLYGASHDFMHPVSSFDEMFRLIGSDPLRYLSGSNSNYEPVGFVIIVVLACLAGAEVPHQNRLKWKLGLLGASDFLILATVLAIVQIVVDVQLASPPTSTVVELLGWVAAGVYSLAITIQLKHAVRWLDDETRCVGCGYSLVGLETPRCPECGRDFDPALLAELSAEEAVKG